MSVMPYYQDSLVTLYVGKQEDVLTQLGIRADLVLTDPPYGTTNLDWDVVPDLPLFWGTMRRLCAPTAQMIIFSKQPFTTDLIASNRPFWRDELIWHKNAATNFLNAKKQPLDAHENIELFRLAGTGTYNPQMEWGTPYSVKRKAKRGSHYNPVNNIDTTNSGTRYPRSVIEGFSKGHQAESRHETAKPVSLLEYLILTYSNPGDLVLDPFVGAGSTAIAAARLGRRCIGVELRSEALDQAIADLAQLPLALLEFAS